MISMKSVLRAASAVHNHVYLSPGGRCHLHLTAAFSKSKKGKLTESEDIDAELKNAAVEVASSLPGDPKKTASDLLSQLRAHAETGSQNDPQSNNAKPAPSLGDLFSGMKIETAGESSSRASHPGQRQKKFRGSRERMSETLDLPSGGLFGAPPLGIFSAGSGQVQGITSTERSLWEKIQEEELQELTRTPPKNGFEEMIQWTQEGKLWHFPIDNEQGIVEEAKYEFNEHVFFDDLLEDFPKKGPVRHFMELVTTGLSKNPYLTVPQKREHVAWFKNYFDEKQHILEDVIASSQES